MDSINGVLKVGKREHLEALRKGIVYCNTLQFFKKLESASRGMGDRFECGEFVEQFDELAVKRNDAYVPVVKNGFAVWDKGKYRGNLFCTYFIDIPVEEVEKNDAYPLNINSSVVGFADSFLVISDVIEFARRFTNAVESTGHKLSHGCVDYFDYKSYKGDLTPFNKHIKFQDQKELRFYINRQAASVADAVSYHLGDLSDIVSEVHDAKSISTLTFFRNNIPV